jgi:hypothetical protein
VFIPKGQCSWYSRRGSAVTLGPAMKPRTPHQHRQAARAHRAAARAEQNPQERAGHLAAAVAHGEAAHSAKAGKDTRDHPAHYLSEDARAKTKLRERYTRILRHLPGRTGRSR